MKCEGDCTNYEYEACFGEVKEVLVSGNGFKKPFRFFYCQAAREEDIRRGFLVEDVDENGLTESDYNTGIEDHNG